MSEKASEPCEGVTRLLGPYSTLCPNTFRLLGCEPLDGGITITIAEACGVRVYTVNARNGSLVRFTSKHCGPGWRLARKTWRSIVYTRGDTLLRVFLSSEAGVDEDRYLEYLAWALPGVAPRLVCKLRSGDALIMVGAGRVEGKPLAEAATSFIAGGRPERAPHLLHLMGRSLALLHQAMEACVDEWCQPWHARSRDAQAWVARLSHRSRVLARAWPENRWARLGSSMLEQLARNLSPQWENLVLVRGHGDPHLYQALIAGQSVVLTDFEGEPLRLPARRWEREPPERDLAVVLRSLDYASWLLGRWPGGDEEVRLALLARSLLDGYTSVSSHTRDFEALAFWLVERASYEIVYELLENTGLEHVPALALAAMARHGPEEYLEALLAGRLYRLAPYMRLRPPHYDP